MLSRRRRSEIQQLVDGSQAKQSIFREPVSTVTHGIGVLLSIAALIALLILAHGRVWQIVSFALYGATLITLYTASTLYHGVKGNKSTTDALRRFDYCAIYLLIAGTYTPVCLVALHGICGWRIIGAEWSLAAVGIIAALLWRTAPDWLRVALYLVMGWMIVIVFPTLKAALPPGGVAWLIAGGIVYSLGTVVFATNRPHLWPGKFSAHDLWHLFVVGGSVCHYVLMATFIARLPF
jgi:hemolysin III